VSIRLKRVYDKPARSDGHRVLVDRLWPRGIKKNQARIDQWLKDVAPSTGYRAQQGNGVEGLYRAALLN